jgi:hypothetical protein
VNSPTCILLECVFLAVSPSLMIAQIDSGISQTETSRRRHDLRLSISDRRVIENGVADQSYNQDPAVVESENGDYLLSYKKGPSHVNDPYVILRHSRDKGKTWGPEIIEWNTDSPDPTLAKTPIHHDLLIEFGKENQSGISGAAYARSDNDGFDWSGFTFFDNPVSDTSFTPTRYLTDDVTMYAAGYGPYGDGTNDAIIWRSTDDGYTWQKLSTVRQPGDAGINETALTKAGQTTLLAISRDDANQNTWAHFSTDVGVSWEPEIDYTPQVGILQLPQLLWINGVLLLFGRDPAANQLVAYVSFDRGQTFTDRQVLDTYTGESIDGGYCWPIVRGENQVFVVYYADTEGLRLPDIKSLIFNLRWKPRVTH